MVALTYNFAKYLPKAACKLKDLDREGCVCVGEGGGSFQCRRRLHVGSMFNFWHPVQLHVGSMFKFRLITIKPAYDTAVFHSCRTGYSTLMQMLITVRNLVWQWRIQGGATDAHPLLGSNSFISCGKVMFSQVYVNNSVHGGGGSSEAGRVVVCGRGDIHGKEGACMAEGGACMAGGCAWQGGEVVSSKGTCMIGGMHASQGVCMVGAEGVHGKGEHAWQGGGHAWQEIWPLQRMVRIPLECILVFMQFLAKISPPHV